jgi:hypothetical protein
MKLDEGPGAFSSADADDNMVYLARLLEGAVHGDAIGGICDEPRHAADAHRRGSSRQEAVENRYPPSRSFGAQVETPAA